MSPFAVMQEVVILARVPDPAAARGGSRGDTDPTAEPLPRSSQDSFQVRLDIQLQAGEDAPESDWLRGHGTSGSIRAGQDWDVKVGPWAGQPFPLSLQATAAQVGEGLTATPGQPDVGEPGGQGSPDQGGSVATTVPAGSETAKTVFQVVAGPTDLATQLVLRDATAGEADRTRVSSPGPHPAGSEVGQGLQTGVHSLLLLHRQLPAADGSVERRGEADHSAGQPGGERAVLNDLAELKPGLGSRGAVSDGRFQAGGDLTRTAEIMNHDTEMEFTPLPRTQRSLALATGERDPGTGRFLSPGAVTATPANNRYPAPHLIADDHGLRILHLDPEGHGDRGQAGGLPAGSERGSVQGQGLSHEWRDMNGTPPTPLAALDPGGAAARYGTAREQKTGNAYLSSLAPSVAAPPSSPAAAAARTAALADRAGSEAMGASGTSGQIRTQIADQLLPLADPGKGSQRITLHLDPPQLGKLEVHIQQDDNRLTVTFQTTSPETEHALREGSRELAEILLTRGRYWSEVQVKTEKDGTESRHEKQSNQDDPHQSRRDRSGSRDRRQNGS